MEITPKELEAINLIYEKFMDALMESRAESEKRAAEFDRQTEEYRKQREEERKQREEEQRKQAEEYRKQREEYQKQKEALDAEVRKADAEMKKAFAVMGKRVDETTKNIGGLNNLLGELTESMFGVELCNHFNELGLIFDDLGPRRSFKIDKKFLAEADFYLENREYAMAVEVKTKLSKEAVNDHLERLGKIRKVLDWRNNKRKLLGAIAGAIIPEGVLEYAQSQGLYVVVQSGESIRVADPPEGFKAREW